MSSIRLLLLEDSELDAELILRQIKEMDQEFEIRLVSLKEDFEREVISWQPELIISDFNLQTFNGGEALAFAKKQAPNIPFITLSGSITKAMELTLLKNRANDVLHKDNLSRLSFAITRVLNEKRDKVKLNHTLFELAGNLKFQEAFAEISLDFNSQLPFSEKINHALEIIGRIVDASRVYIFENFGDNKTKNTFEWCGENVVPQISELQNVSYKEDIPSWKAYFKKYGNIYFEDVKEAPKDIQEILMPQDIQAIIAYPINIKGSFFGFIGFDETRRIRKWSTSEDKLLKSVSGLISNAYSEELSKRSLKDSNKKLKELLKEKEVLVGEVHHRVKNNLALISSFLQLDKMGVGNHKTTDEIVSANILRIKSIAIIHELVYQDGTFSNINVLKTLQKILIESFSERRNIKLDFEIENSSKGVFFNINQAVPFSLLISEIMFQVFSIEGEHQYKANKKLRIKVEAHKKWVSVYLKDTNLVRLFSKLQEGEEFNFSELIDVLSRQLGAELIINEEKDTAKIVFENKNRKGASTNLIKH